MGLRVIDGSLITYPYKDFLCGAKIWTDFIPFLTFDYKIKVSNHLSTFTFSARSTHLSYWLIITVAKILLTTVGIKCIALHWSGKSHYLSGNRDGPEVLEKLWNLKQLWALLIGFRYGIVWTLILGWGQLWRTLISTN